MKRCRALALLLLFALSACGGSDGGYYDFEPFNLVSNGLQSGLAGQQLRVVESDTQLAELLSVMNISGEVPATDFTTHRLVVITTGYNSGCGDYVGVERVDASDYTVLIRGVMAVPDTPAGCPAPTADSPYAMLELARSAKPVSLLLERVHY